MLAEEIRKTSFETLSLNNARTKLATEARDILGYNRLALATCTPGALLFSMRELDIHPLNTDDVELYKASKEKIGMWSNEKRMWAWAAAFLLSTPVFCALIAKWIVMQATPLRVAEVVGCGLAIILTLTRFCCNLSGQESGKRKTTRWYTVGIKDYNGFIPEHAVDKAVQIGKAVPHTRFEVDYLGTKMDEKERIIPDRDPFLKITLPSTGECYYIDVWQERDFELYIEDKV